jgi:hypothetical protein
VQHVAFLSLRFVFEKADETRTILGEFAKSEDLDQLAEVEIDETIIQQKLNEVASIVIGKRRVAVQEIEKLAKIEQQERKTTSSVDKVLDFDAIVKKANSKPRKKVNTVKGEPGDMTPSIDGESREI